MLRATVTRSFNLKGRGTVLCLSIDEGTVQAGDVVHISALDCETDTGVISVEFVDSQVGTPNAKGEPAILVGALAPETVPPGSAVSG